MRALPRLSPAVMALNPALAEGNEQRPTISTDYPLTREKVSPEAIEREKQLQRLCEDWLYHHGYIRLTPENILSGRPRRGYQAHLVRCRKNPILLDLTIFGLDGRYIMVELKYPGRKPSDHQSAIIKYNDHAYLCDNFPDFERIVTAWEQKTKGVE